MKGSQCLKGREGNHIGLGKSSTRKLAEKDAKGVSQQEIDLKGLEIHAKKFKLYFKGF